MAGALVALETLGCKLNQAETESLGRRLRRHGLRLTSHPDGADAYVLNTCTVTGVADRKSRQRVRQARRSYPEAFIVAVGCCVDRCEADLVAAGADLVLSNAEKDRLPELLASRFDSRQGSDADSSVIGWGRTRALVRVQSGCEDFCSFCVVPRVRGREICVPSHEVIQEVRERVAEGFHEVVLTGTKIGAYWEEGLGGLASLVRRLLDETRIERLRLSSVQPQEITPGLLGLWQDRRLCPHLHMSLQSGSDAVLHRMGRRYTPKGFREAIESIRQGIPEVAITTDVIVGFPGETDAEFEETYRFCEEVGFARIHVFPFSPRSGTPAERMRGQVDPRVKKARALRMGALARQSMGRFAQGFLGRTMPVLWERETSAGRWSGLTGNYLQVSVPSDQSLEGDCVPARLESICGDGLRGELADAPVLVGNRGRGERDE